MLGIDNLLQENSLGNELESDTKQLSRSASVISAKSVTNLVKGKSMPSLRYEISTISILHYDTTQFD